MVYELRYQIPYEPMHARKALDGSTDDIRLVDETPEPGLVIAAGSQILDAGRAIRPNHLPTTMQIGGGQRGVTDFDGYSGLVYVSAALKNIIEQLEPDTHQFFPIRLVDKQGNHLGDHWIWVICNRVDGIDREQTSLVLWKGVLWLAPSSLSEDELPPGVDRSVLGRRVFNASQVAGYHFWRDKYLIPGDIFCSDEAARRIADANFTGIKLVQAEMV
jgi:hypothetical protein